MRSQHPCQCHAAARGTHICSCCGALSQHAPHSFRSSQACQPTLKGMPLIFRMPSPPKRRASVACISLRDTCGRKDGVCCWQEVQAAGLFALARISTDARPPPSPPFPSSTSASVTDAPAPEAGLQAVSNLLAGHTRAHAHAHVQQRSISVQWQAVLGGPYDLART